MRRSQLAAGPSTLAVKQRAEAFLLSAGFVRSSGDMAGRWTYRAGPRWRGRTPIRIVFEDDSFGVHLLCKRRGIVIPTGPMMSISYDWVLPGRP